MGRKLDAKTINKKTVLPDGTYRYETDKAGVIACIDTGGKLLLDDLTARLRQFTKTGNLASLGQLRYVSFRRSVKGTTILALWTEGSASVLDMFPVHGDAPGVDPRDFPRPGNVRRLLSANEQGQPYAVTVYESETMSVEQLRDWYLQSLRVKDWTNVGTFSKDSLVVKHGDRIVNVILSTAANHHTTITIAELG